MKRMLTVLALFYGSGVSSGCGDTGLTDIDLQNADAQEAALFQPPGIVEGRGPMWDYDLPPMSPVEGSSFWYGGDLFSVLEESDVVDLHEHFAQLTPKFLQAYALFENTPDLRPDLAGAGEGLKYHDPNKTWDGYTLLTSLGTHLDEQTGEYNGAILIDMYGNIVKEWPLTGFPCKMLPGGYVLGGKLIAGRMTELLQLDWCGNEVASWTVPDGAGWHHDFQREGSSVGYYAPGALPSPYRGKTLLLTQMVAPFSETQHISTEWPLYDDQFYELDWDGNVIWQWDAWRHFDQMGFDENAKAAINGIQVPGGTPTSTDWTHMNQAAYLGPNKWYARGDLRFHPDNIIFDTRTSNIIAIVARHDHPEGDWMSGDIVWRIGPSYCYGNKEYEVGQIIGPHMAHMIPARLPGAGNILVFDNGGFAGYGSFMTGMPGTWPSKFRDYSRVIEINPVTLEVVWEYSFPRAEDGNEKLFSTLISGAQRLHNGNTLITMGGRGRIIEVTSSKEIVWEYVSPFAARPFGGPGALLGPSAVYRAYRVPQWWVPEQVQCTE